MDRKRKKDDCAEEWDVVEETQDFDAIPPLFELVAETQNSVATPLPFETVSETQDSDAEVDAVTDVLPPLPQEPLAPPTYRIKDMTKEINSSVICKLTRICRLPLLVEEIKKDNTELKYRETRRLVGSCYRVRSAPEKDDDDIPTGKTVKWQIRANCAHFLHKLYDMLAWMEKVVDKHPKTKGARLYSLLPVATTFQAAEVIRKVFDVEQFEIRNRKFADKIKTNGYGASITMIRPVTTTSVVVVEKKASKKKRKKNDGTAELVSKEKKVETPEDIAEEDMFAKELFKLGIDHSPDVLIGIDPGMRHLARMNDFRFYNENPKRWEPWYTGVIRAMPSFKISSYDLYFQRLQFFWKHLRFLLAFSAEQAFLRWRFTQDCAKMKALDTLAKRLVPKASKQVCIAYGDWSRRIGIKDHASGLVKEFIEALKRRATVIPMDEYRTSITCSCCHQRLKQTRLFTKMKRKEDEVGIRQKEQLSMKEVKEIVEMARFRNPKLVDKKVVLKCTRNVLRCTNSGCKANFWNRDVNAARNMLELLKSGLKGKHGARRL
ncbi:hypothetical protein BBJ29_005603 [Phytophthora kernoviae]|uniref:Uncharacterized protein n=1 Tax=Phytophthora kernoviae TaxID=325452 RepID=A0A421G894_9STRA|nr:hypothetical protein BBJ29_005603 [Phytophthora kernoviae]